MTSPMSLKASNSLGTPTSPSQRELDEVSIASDFSVIPESLVELEVGDGRGIIPRGGVEEVVEEEEEDQRHFSTSSFLHSADLQISKSAMETHSKVQFYKLQPSYYLDSDIPVTYSLGPQITPESSDRVGLYKVGFGTIQDYVDYHWAPVPSTQQRASTLPLTVVFRASSFQREQNAGEFFQFCYVTHSGEIVGVSSPFQLLHVGAAGGEVCGVEEEEVAAGSGGTESGGMIVVRSKESVLQERLVKLSQEKEALTTRVEEVEEKKEEAEKKVEEQTQQLSLCQHHLMALEVKLKRETAEKCELMGRVGQVVEERGHLEEKVRGVERTLTSERNKTAALEETLAKSEGRLRVLDEAALVSRKALEEASRKMKSLTDELSTSQQALKSATAEAEKMTEERNKAIKDLELWTSNVEADQQEKNSLALKYSVVTEELIGKEEELEETRRKVYRLEERLEKAEEELAATQATLSLSAKEVEALTEERRVHLDRETVVKGDMAHLKERLAALEEEQKKERSGREAAETIACDLSSRLQAAKAEYQRLAVTNHKLVKKLKKTRTRATASIGSSSSGVESLDAEGQTQVNKHSTERNKSAMTASMNSWIHADMEGDEEEEEEEEEEEVEVPSSLTQSTITTNTTPSCCSHTTQQLSEVVNQKMEDIVKELSQQILSLKLQLQEKEQLGRDADGASAEGKDVSRPGAKVEVEDGGTEAGETSELGGKSDTGSVLYGKSFLPAEQTAPVFLPESATPNQASSNTPGTPSTPYTPPTPTPTPTTQGNTTLTQSVASITSGLTNAPNSPSVNTHGPTADPTPAPRAQYYHPRPLGPPQTPGAALPPPLQPESTQTARQAAVLSQFSQHSSSSSTSVLPTAPPLIHAAPHDSDDDDFHSTDSDTPPATPPAGTASSQPQQIPESRHHRQEQRNGPPSPHLSPGTSPSSPPLLDCPMCSLCFPLGTLQLLQEHINSHLEHVCPVCSQAFQRNCRDKFVEHVQSHFEEEEAQEVRPDEPPMDTSGPWGEVRGRHLLEID